MTVDKVFRRVWVPAGFIMLLVTGTVLWFRWAGRPRPIASCPNPAGTVVAQVYSHDSSFSDTPYSVYLEPRPGGWLRSETEVIYLSNAGFRDKSGPQVEWLNAQTLAVKSDAGHAFFFDNAPLTSKRSFAVRQGGRETTVNVKFTVPRQE